MSLYRAIRHDHHENKGTDEINVPICEAHCVVRASGRNCGVRWRRDLGVESGESGRKKLKHRSTFCNQLFFTVTWVRFVCPQMQARWIKLRVQQLSRGINEIPWRPGLWKGSCKATWKREFKLPWREAGSPNHHDDRVDSDQ